MKSALNLLLLLLVALATAEDCGGYTWAACTGLEGAKVNISDGCYIDGKFIDDVNNIVRPVRGPCEAWGWIFSARQPKGCRIGRDNCLGYDHDEKKTHPVTQYQGWCYPLEGIDIHPTWDSCNVTGYIMITEKLEDKTERRSKGVVFYISRPCEEDDWIFKLHEPARCLVLEDSAGVRFLRAEKAPPEIPESFLRAAVGVFIWTVVAFAPIFIFNLLHECVKRIDPTNVCIFTGLTLSMPYY